MDRKGEAQPCPVLSAGKRGPTQVTPENKYHGWNHNDIVRDIMKKNNNRGLCTSYLYEPVDDDTAKECIFYDHQPELMEAADKEMSNPKEDYTNNREQGARLACYELWTMIQHGRLGRSRRRPLPACVEAHIKMINPSAYFTGYVAKEEKDSSGEDDQSDDDTWQGRSSPLLSYKKPKIE